MAPGAFSPLHILIVLTVALLVLGPKELPKVVRAGAKAMRELRDLRARLDEELHALLEDDPDAGEDFNPVHPPPEPAPAEHTPPSAGSTAAGSTAAGPTATGPVDGGTA